MGNARRSTASEGRPISNERVPTVVCWSCRTAGETTGEIDERVSSREGRGTGATEASSDRAQVAVTIGRKFEGIREVDLGVSELSQCS